MEARIAAMIRQQLRRITNHQELPRRDVVTETFKNNLDTPVDFEETQNGIRVFQGGSTELVTNVVAVSICKGRGRGFLKRCQAAILTEPKQSCAHQVLECCTRGLAFLPTCQEFGINSNWVRTAVVFRNMQGKALMVLQRIEEAIQVFQQALVLMQEHCVQDEWMLRLEAHDHLGKAQFELGRYAIAVSHFVQVSRLQEINSAATQFVRQVNGQGSNDPSELAMRSPGYFSPQDCFTQLADAEVSAPVPSCGESLSGFKRMWDFRDQSFREFNVKHQDPARRRKQPARWRRAALPRGNGSAAGVPGRVQCALSTWRNVEADNPTFESGHGSTYEDDVLATADHQAKSCEQQMATCESLAGKAKAYISLGRIFRELHQSGYTMKMIEQGLEAAQEAEDVQLLCEGFGVLADLSLRDNDAEAAKTRQEVRRELASDRFPRQSFEASLGLALVCIAQGDREQAVRHLDDAQRAARAAARDSPRSLHVMLSQVGEQLCQVGRFEQAAELHCEQLDLAIQCVDRRAIVHALMGLGNVCFSLGEHEVALTTYNESLRAATEVEYSKKVCSLTYNIGEARWALGQYLEAGEAFKEARQRSAEGASGWPELVQACQVKEETSHFMSATVHWWRDCSGSLSYTLDLFGKAIREFEFIKDGSIPDQFGAHFMQGLSFSSLGLYSEAVKCLHAAIDVTYLTYEGEPATEGEFFRPPQQWNVNRTLYRCVSLGCLGRAWLLQDQYATAIPFLEQYLEVAQSLAAAAPPEGTSEDPLACFHEGDVHHDYFALPDNNEANQEERAACRSLSEAWFGCGDHTRAFEYHRRWVSLAAKTGEILPGTQHLDFEAALIPAMDVIANYEQLLKSSQSGSAEQHGALLALGEAYLKFGLHKWAVRLFQEALLVAEALHDFTGMARTYGNLAEERQNQGDLRQATAMACKQIEHAKKGTDTLEQTRAYKRIFDLLVHQGQAERGLEYLREWLHRAEVSGEAEQEHEAHSRLRNALRDIGRFDEASQVQAVSEVDPIVPLDCAGDKHLRSGDHHFRLGEYGSAIGMYNKEMRIAGETQDMFLKGLAAGRLGRTYSLMGQHLKAADMQSTSLQIARHLNHRLAEAEVQNDMGDACFAIACNGPGHEHAMQDEAVERFANTYTGKLVTMKLSAAQSAYQDALSMLEEFGSLKGQIQSYAGLGKVAQHEQKWDKALEYHQEQLCLAHKTGDVLAQGHALLDIAKASLSRHRAGKGTELSLQHVMCKLWASVQHFRVVELGVKGFDEQRISLLELQQEGLQLLQQTLLQEHPGGETMSLAVAELSKARALLGMIDSCQDSDAVLGFENTTPETEWGALEEHLMQEWNNIQTIIRGEQNDVVMVEYSFLGPEQLAVWVVSSRGKLLSYKVLDGEVDEALLFGGLNEWADKASHSEVCFTASNLTADGLAQQVAAYHQGGVVKLTKQLAHELDKEEAVVRCFTLVGLVDMVRAAIGVDQRDLRGASDELRATESEQDFERLFRLWVQFKEGEGLTDVERFELTLGVQPTLFKDLDIVYADPALLAQIEHAWNERKLVHYLLDRLKAIGSAQEEAVNAKAGPCDSEQGSSAEAGEGDFVSAVDALASKVASWRDVKRLGCNAQRLQKELGIPPRVSRRISGALSSVLRPARLLAALHDKLIAPIQPHLQAAQEVLLVPHRALFEVPWAALAPLHGPCLVQRFALRLSPSLRIAAALAPRARGSAGPELASPPQCARAARAVVVGNPVPLPCGWAPLQQAEEEAREVARVLARLEGEAGGGEREARQVSLLLREHATKAAVRRGLAGSSWAHLACHGNLDKSALLLAPGEQASGELSMEEVLGGARLAAGATVVLSACDSGRGRVRAEGVVGVARGFLGAGAACAVVSLWQLPDASTREFMRRFYELLLQGKTTPQACRFAMLGMAQLDPVAPDAAAPEPDVRPRKRFKVSMGQDFSAMKCWSAFVVTGASTQLRALPLSC